MIIFLDIDGVMVPAKGWVAPVMMEDGFYVFSPNAVLALNSILSNDTTIMLTTSHRHRYNADSWLGIFERRGLLVSKMETIGHRVNCASRKDEIIDWFAENSLNESFVIIDDDKSLNDLPTILKKHLVLTNSMVGLNLSHLHDVGQILNVTKKIA